jgi:RNA polymerase sigma-70 factor (ECF subfamily)
VRADDPAAWDRLVELYAPLVYHWCRRWSLQDQDAADIFQEVFQSVARSIRDFRKERSGDTFRGWLRTITRNKVLDLFRRRRREPVGEGGTSAQRRFTQLPSEIPSLDEESDSHAEQSLLLRALESIRSDFEERTWQAFWKTAVEGQPARDVADDLAMTPGAVRVAKSRVLHRLRRQLGDYC